MKNLLYLIVYSTSLRKSEHIFSGYSFFALPQMEDFNGIEMFKNQNNPLN